MSKTITITAPPCPVHLAADPTGSSRYSMRAVAFDGVRAMATNGRMLAICRHSTPPAIIDSEAVGAAFKAHTDAERRFQDPTTAGFGTITVNGRAEVRIPAKGKAPESVKVFDTLDPEMKFPPALDIVPAPDDYTFAGCFNAELLLELAKAIQNRHADNPGAAVVQLFYRAPNKPLVLTTSSGNAVGIIMPVSAPPRELEHLRKTIDTVKAKATDEPKAKKARKTDALNAQAMGGIDAGTVPGPTEEPAPVRMVPVWPPRALHGAAST